MVRSPTRRRSPRRSRPSSPTTTFRRTSAWAWRTSASSCARSTCRRSRTPSSSTPPFAPRRPTTSRCRWTRRSSTTSRSGWSQTAGGPRMRVVIVAARRELIDRLVSATKDAGLKVEGIDLAAFGMVRALASKEEEGAVLYINVAGLTNVAVANQSGCLFTRAAAGGLCSDRRDARRAPLAHARARADVARPRRPRDAAGVRRGRRRARRRHPGHPRRGRAPAGRHRSATRSTSTGCRTTRRRSDGRSSRAPPRRSPASPTKLAEQLNLPVEIAVVATDESLEGDVDPGRLTVAAGLAVEDR